MSALNKLNHLEYFLNYWYSFRTSKLHKIREKIPRDSVFLWLYFWDSPGFLVLPFKKQKELSNTILGSYEIIIKALVASVELLSLILIARFFLPRHSLKLPGHSKIKMAGAARVSTQCWCHLNLPSMSCHCTQGKKCLWWGRKAGWMTNITVCNLMGKWIKALGKGQKLHMSIGMYLGNRWKPKM